MSWRNKGADFSLGFTFWFDGWRHLLEHKTLLRLALIPFLLAVLATIGIGVFLFGHLGQVTQEALAVMHVSGWMHGLLYYPLLVSAGILVVMVTVFVAYALQTIVAVPFYALLVERTLGQIGKKSKSPRSLSEWLRKSLSMLRVSLLKVLLFLFAGAVLFVFSFLPVLNLLAFAGAMLLVAFDCMDYSFEALEFNLRQRLAYLFREWAQWAGMAAALGLTLFLPGLTLLVIPGAVVGAARIIKAERRYEP